VIKGGGKAVLRVGYAFQFEPPPEWTEFTEGGQHIFQGPNSEDLILSGSTITGVGETAELQKVRSRLLQNAIASANQAASHPALIITKPMAKDGEIQVLECWTIHAETSDKQIMFSEAVFAGDRSVLLITFEAPNTSASNEIYRNFLRSVYPSPSKV